LAATFEEKYIIAMRKPNNQIILFCIIRPKKLNSRTCYQSEHSTVRA
jgi:hypothetical protein